MQPDTPDHKNLIIALVISTVILMGWHVFYEMPRQEAAKAAQAEVEAQAAMLAAAGADATPLPDTGSLQAAAESGDSGDSVPATPVSAQEALTEVPRIDISSDELHGSLSLKGARFDDLTLGQYRQTLADDSPEVRLLSPARAERGYFAELGWLPLGDNITLPNSQTVWSSTDTRLTPNNPVILYWVSPQNVRFEMEVAMDEHFMFTVTQRVINLSGSTLSLAPYGLINRSYAHEGQQFFILHEGPLGLEDDALMEVGYDDLREDGPKKIDDTHGWIGITDKYWLTAIIPEEGRFKATYQHYTQGDGERFQTDLLGKPVKIAPGGTTTYTTRLFAGAKEVWLLDEYSEEYTIPLFDRTVDFGYLYFLTKPIFLMLDYFYSLIGNFGLAILLLTIIIKAILFPLANKSYVAMAQMKQLMPKMQEIRERYEDDDKVKMNQEIIQLYKKEGVNPASGCLPMLIQLPIFFALYKVLFVTIEMRHAPFYGWIDDLSAKDPTNLFTLFGLIPWEPTAVPLIGSLLHIGLWPLIMAATMILQQRLSPKPTDPIQAQVMQTLPFLFLFLFATFPAGLVIYWAWNNTLSILQQWVIMKRAGTLPEKKSRKRKAA